MGCQKVCVGRESEFYGRFNRVNTPNQGVAWLDDESERVMSDEDRSEMGRRLEAAMREALAHARGDEELRETRYQTWVRDKLTHALQRLDEEESLSTAEVLEYSSENFGEALRCIRDPCGFSGDGSAS